MWGEGRSLFGAGVFVVKKIMSKLQDRKPPEATVAKYWNSARTGLIWFVLLAYVLWPMVMVLRESVWSDTSGFSLAPWREFISKGHGIYALRGAWISIATVALAGVFGTALAFFYYRLDFPGRAIFAALSLLPFTLPPLVGVFAIWTLMAEGGPADRISHALFGVHFWIEKGYSGVLLVHVYSMYVYFFVMVGGALAGFDESQIEAARNLGAGRRTTFLRVVAPQLIPALAGASLLAFMTSMASFTAPYFYMAGRPVLTVGIQQALEESRPGLAAADGVALALIAGVFLILNSKLERIHRGGSKGVARRRTRLASPWLRMTATAVAAVLTLVLLSPQIALVREALIAPGTGFVGKPTEYTFGNFTRLFRDGSTWHPMVVSLKASALATLAILLFSPMTAWIESRRKIIGQGLMRWLVMLPWALPGTVIGVGLLWMTRSPNLLTAGMALRGTALLLALAYFIRLLPLAHRTIVGGFSRVSPEIEGAARDLGANPRKVFLRVTLPLILGALLAAGILTFTTAMGEFVSSILLYGPGEEPVAVKIDQLRRGPAGMQLASAYSVLLTLLIAGTFLLGGAKEIRRVG